MISFPQYAWDEWLDLHGQQVHIIRHEAKKATGIVRIVGIAGTEIPEGTIFCTPATESGVSLEFCVDQECMIGENGIAEVKVTAMEAGSGSNVKANTISIMAKPIKGISEITNPEQIQDGADREKNDDYYDRIAAEYENSRTYLGNDGDYVRWAKEAGAGDCIVIPAAEGPGTVKLVLIDGNGQPANEELVKNVYQHIVSPDDRSKRLLPTACAKLSCTSATTVKISYECGGILHDSTTDINQIEKEFKVAVQNAYADAKKEGILRYNDIRPIISNINGVLDFSTFLMNGSMENIIVQKEEYPETGTLIFYCDDK